MYPLIRSCQSIWNRTLSVTEPSWWTTFSRQISRQRRHRGSGWAILLLTGDTGQFCVLDSTKCHYDAIDELTCLIYRYLPVPTKSHDRKALMDVDTPMTDTSNWIDMFSCFWYRVGIWGYICVDVKDLIAWLTHSSPFAGSTYSISIWSPL